MSGIVFYIPGNYKKTKSPVLLKAIADLSDDWRVYVAHKVNIGIPKSTPIYATQGKPLKPSRVTRDVLVKAVDKSDKVLPVPGDYYETDERDGYVRRAMTVVSFERWVTPDTFDTDMKDIFNIFTRLLALK